MGKLYILTGAVAAMCLLTAWGDSLVLRPHGDQRVWQTVFDATEPIQWRWEANATKAAVTVSNRVTGVAGASVEVVRAASAKYGSYALPSVATAENGEAMITLKVVQQDAQSAALATEEAPLTILPAAITVEKAKRVGMTRTARPVAYDAAWADATDATGATYSFNGGAATDLGTTSGWFVQAASNGTLRVSFTGTDKALTGQVFPPPGAILLLR